MADLFAGGHLRFINGEWRDDNGDPFEIAEVVHGFNKYDYNSAFECSVCGWQCWDTIPGDTEVYNYCPNCGAKMKGGE